MKLKAPSGLKYCTGKYGCGQLKLLDEFPLRKDSPDGRRSQCNPCRNAYVQDWKSRKDQIKAEKERLDHPPVGFKYCRGELGCGKLKPLDEFSPSKHNKDGHKSYCKDCDTKNKAADWEKNKDKYSVKSKVWRDNHKEELKEYNRQYIIDNKEPIAATKKIYGETHKDEIKEKNHVHYINNKEEVKAKNRDYKHKNIKEIMRKQMEQIKTNPIVKLRFALRSRFHSLIRTGRLLKNGRSAIKLIGCSLPDFKSLCESKFYTDLQTKEEMTWENYGSWHFDHIRPLDSFNLEDPEQVKAAFHYTNIQPLWARHNLSKGDRMMNEEELEQLKTT